jgi:sulfofructose kinase
MTHVVCVGLATRDAIYALPRHPQSDEVVVARDLVVAGGGPAATAAVALARLGVQTYFIGAIGDDEVGRFTRESLVREGVDVSELAVRPGARSAQSSILLNGLNRAIAAFRGTAIIELSRRARQLCRDADWVHVDQTGYGTVPPDVRLSIDGGNPIDDLDLDGVALYAPTEANDDGSRAELTVVTRGSAGCVAYAANETIEAPGYPVEAVSTLGAGDVFHGALLAALVRDLPLADALASANACASLSCRALDGRTAIPTLDELERSLT